MENISKQEIFRLTEELSREIEPVRHIVMTHGTYDREFEQALRRYDELAIRLDQMRKVLKLFDAKE